MRRVLLVAALLVGGCSVTAPDTASTRCEEDQPCWDCETMGNRICGPTTTFSEMLTETLPGPFPGWGGAS